MEEEKNSKKKSNNRKIILGILGIVIIVLLLLATYFLLFNKKTDEKQQDNLEDSTENKIDESEMILILKNLTIKEGTEYTINQFIKKCSNSIVDECNLKYEIEEMETYTEIGTYDITIIETYDNDNQIIKNCILKIVAEDSEELDNIEENDDIQGLEVSGENNELNNSNKTTTTTKPNNNSNSSNKTTTTTTKPSTTKTTTTTTKTSTNKTTTTARTKIDNITETTEEYSYKYGTTIKKITYNYYDVYSDGTKEYTGGYDSYEYDYSTFNGTTSDLSPEALSLTSQNNGTINEVLNYVNQYRAEVGAQPLTLDSTLTLAATIRSLEMGWGNNFSHTRPNGSSCFTIANDLGINYYMIGENIAYNYFSAASVSEGWKNSPGHYANMVSTSFNKIGIGLANVNGSNYWTQIFTN